MLDLRQLRHFIAIVDLGSLTRAAESGSIAQPALSQQVAALEAELGVKLLNRCSQGVTPTDAGKTLYRHARLVLQQLDALRTAVRVTGEGIAGRVSIGLSVTTSEILCVPLLQSLRERHPGLQPEVTALPNRLLREMLIKGRLDVALLFDQPRVKGIVPRRVATEELFFITRGDAAASECLPASVAEVARHDLILPCSPHGVRMTLEAAFCREGLDHKVVAELDSIPSLMEAVRCGIGVTVMPWSAVHRYADGLTARPFAQPMTRDIMLCLCDSTPPADTVLSTAAVILETIESLVATRRWRGVVCHDAAEPQTSGGECAVPP